MKAKANLEALKEVRPYRHYRTWLCLAYVKFEVICLQHDNLVLNDERNFKETALEYVLVLQEVQEKKKFEFVETVQNVHFIQNTPIYRLIRAIPIFLFCVPVAGGIECKCKVVLCCESRLISAVIVRQIQSTRSLA